VFFVVMLDIKLPKSVAELIRRDSILRSLVESVAERNIMEVLIEIFALDQLLSSSRLTEEDIIELDRIIKTRAWEKLRKYVGSGHE